MKMIIGKIIKTLLKAVFTQKMLIWGLKFWAKQTDNKIDDNAVLIVEAGLNSDIEGIQKGVQQLSEEVFKKD
jgi:hypothetical protein